MSFTYVILIPTYYHVGITICNYTGYGI